MDRNFAQNPLDKFHIWLKEGVESMDLKFEVLSLFLIDKNRVVHQREEPCRGKLLQRTQQVAFAAPHRANKLFARDL